MGMVMNILTWIFCWIVTLRLVSINTVNLLQLKRINCFNLNQQVIQLGTDILSDQCPLAFPELLNQNIKTNIEKEQSVTKQEKKNCFNQPFHTPTLRFLFKNLFTALIEYLR